MNTPEQLPEASSLKDAGRKIREIITYLRSLRLTAGQGIRLDHYAAGTTISLSHTPAPTGKSSANEYTGGFRLVDMSETVKEKDEEENEIEKVIPKIKVDFDVNDESNMSICTEYGRATFYRGSSLSEQRLMFDLSDYMQNHEPATDGLYYVYVYAYLSATGDALFDDRVISYNNIEYMMDTTGITSVLQPLYAGIYLTGPWGETRDTDKGPDGICAQVPIGSFRIDANGKITNIAQKFKGGSELYISSTMIQTPYLAQIESYDDASGLYVAKILEYNDAYNSEPDHYSRHVYVSLPEIAYGAEVPTGTVINIRSVTTLFYDLSAVKEE